MTVAASPAQSEDNLARRSDIDRTWLTAEEIREVVQHDCHERGVRFRRDLFENECAVHEALRKRMAMGGDGSTSSRQLARDLYPDVGEDTDAWRRKRNSIIRWLRLLERQGVITRAQVRSSSGKDLGVRVSLRPVSEVAALTCARSSAG